MNDRAQSGHGYIYEFSPGYSVEITVGRTDIVFYSENI